MDEVKEKTFTEGAETGSNANEGKGFNPLRP